MNIVIGTYILTVGYHKLFYNTIYHISSVQSNKI